jgi:hypothetical protein
VERVDAQGAPASALGKALACADPLAMVQLLVERGRLDAGLDYSGTWPGCFPAPVLLRGQLDLRRQFTPAQA